MTFHLWPKNGQLNFLFPISAVLGDTGTYTFLARSLVLTGIYNEFEAILNITLHRDLIDLR